MSEEKESAQQQTLRQLIEAKKEAREAVRFAESERQEQHTHRDNGDFRASVNGTIRAFLRELRAVRRNFNEDSLETDYWETATVGTIDLPDGQQIRLEGIDDVVTLKNPIEIEVEQSTPGHGPATEMVTKQFYPPTRIYVEAYFLGVEWMAGVGLMPSDQMVNPEANPVDPAHHFNE